MTQSTQFQFAPFRLDPSQISLWRDAEEVALSPKVFDLLCYLARHAGRWSPRTNCSMRCGSGVSSVSRA